MIIGMTVVKMRHAETGREVEFHWHPTVAGQMRVFYEKKGWVWLNRPDDAPAEPRRGPGRPPKSE